MNPSGNSNDPYRIAPVRSRADLDAVTALFEAYAAAIGVDLAYQDFAAELAGLPGMYAPPGGELLLARGPDGAALGCVALRPMGGDGLCEMKRLFVSPQARGTGLGRGLACAIVEAARAIGYREMRLDSLPSMAPAIALYRALGFHEIAPYYATPVAGTVFLARELAAKPAP
jgi:ribosomal protein S18 acetylase RimI-like enzyme